MFAAQHGHVDAVKVLVDHGANIDVTSAVWMIVLPFRVDQYVTMCAYL